MADWNLIALKDLEQLLPYIYLSKETQKMSDVKRILFVDDDESVLSGLRRLLHKKEGEWDMDFFENGHIALKAMDKDNYDIVVTDLRMPEIGGVEFLEIVRKRHPDATRLMLSGCSEQPMYGKAVSCAHQFIAKPCDSDQLISQLSRSFAIRNKIRSQKVAKILPSLRSLPAMPDVYRRVLDMIEDPRCTSRKVGEVISKDIGMSAKILQIVNSAFYGPSTKISDPVRASVYLGIKAIKALSLTDGVFSTLSEEKVERFCVSGLQEHCVRVGALARSICKSQKLTDQQQEIAMMAGILHDTGKMILISEFDYELAEITRLSREEKRPCHEIERETIDLTHAELGGCLLNLWGLGNDIIEAATFHHEPEQCVSNGFSIATSVYLANAIDHQLCSSLGDGWSEDIHMSIIESLDLTEMLPEWQKLHVPTEVVEHEYV
jgi:putative nucleotidyltransferase with HDIG domain